MIETLKCNRRGAETPRKTRRSDLESGLGAFLGALGDSAVAFFPDL
jgi:hypothetical protein